MEKKTVFRYIKPGDLTAMERELDELALQGLGCARPGRLWRRYAPGAEARWHRIGYSRTGAGSADEITYLAAQERAGWQLLSRRKNWLLFARPRGADEQKPELTTHREPVKAHFAPIIARWESARRVMLVLGTLLLLAGFAGDFRPVQYCAVLPLVVALIATYAIKFLQEGPDK